MFEYQLIKSKDHRDYENDVERSWEQKMSLLGSHASHYHYSRYAREGRRTVPAFSIQQFHIILTCIRIL